jgi:hypothetical protein
MDGTGGPENEGIVDMKTIKKALGREGSKSSKIKI